MFRNVKKEEITIPAQMSYMGQVRDFIEHIGSKYKYPDKIINSYKLVIEEACTNIIRHGYRDIKGGEISIKAIIRQQSLTIVILDQGISYDPRQAQTPDLEKYIQIGKKGGLGIFMMRKLMDDVQYNITSRGNELRLTKQREEIDLKKMRAVWEGFSLRTRYTIGASAIITFLALAIFTFVYSVVDQSVLDDTIEYARAQVLSLADNSSEYLQENNDLDLFTIAQAFRTNNPDLVYETFIVDTSTKIVASSTPLKTLGHYRYPEEVTTVEDSLNYYSIYKYRANDSLEVYDFTSKIFMAIRGSSPLVGEAHLWVTADHIQSRSKSAKLNIILITLILLIVLYVGTYYLIDRIVSPFHSLADWVHQVGQGTVDEDEIDIDASDELGEIAQAFNRMTAKFREAQVSVIEQQRLQKELQVAQEIQQMLLPSDFPQVKGYDLASYYEAAKEVGGDLFDFVEVDSDTLGICVADVAGKGVPGSLIMTMIRTALRLEARDNKNPADVLSRVNRFVTDDMKRGMFVTMFYLVLDSRNRMIHYASAGHNPMILYRGSTKQTYFLNPSGFPVGIQLPDITLFDRKIEQDSIRLREDDLLVLYTDGITEAMNPKRDLYREERFLDAIRTNSHFDVSDFIANIKNDIKSHTQGYPQNDDITFVAVKEKLMQGEVIYSIHKELFRLIEEEKVPVMDACEKMQVSPYAYRKYKKVKDDVGLEGLKELLYEGDYIEKKHLSIEVKTRLYDIVGNFPEYGPKKISEELNTEKYFFTKLEPSRIYAELVKAKLNTKEKREAFIKRGGKKRLKPPGTPLLTLDGKVILDYESVEKVIQQKTGSAFPDSMKPVAAPASDRKVINRELSSTKSDDRRAEKFSKEKAVSEIIESQKTAAKTVLQRSKIKKEVKEHRAVEKEEKPAKIKKPADAKIVLDFDKPKLDIESKKAIEAALSSSEKFAAIEGDKAGETSKPQLQAAPPGAESDVAKTAERTISLSFEDEIKKLEIEKQQAEKSLQAEKFKIQQILKERSASKKTEEQEITISDRPPRPVTEDQEKIARLAFEAPDEKISKEKVEAFYALIHNELNEIETIVDGWTNSNFKKADLLNIGKVLGIVSKKPLFSSLGRAEQLFVQVIRYLEFMESNTAKMDDQTITQNSKDILKYIEKENILSNSTRILEQINEVGIKNHHLQSQVKSTKSENQSQLDSIRKKLAKGNIIKNNKILNNIAKTNRH
jgi:serine phosphatase RsbU (regulator of sigma subunit)/anti-sigma regulatory factor (Ser/Thr protein kinase)